MCENECLNKLKHETVKQNFADYQIHRSELYKMEVNNLKEKSSILLMNFQKSKMVIHLKDVEEYGVSEISEILEMGEMQQSKSDASQTKVKRTNYTINEL